MKKLALMLAAIGALSFCVKFSHAADDSGKSEKVTGILIDDHCAKGMMKKDDPQAAAAKHKASCANSCVNDKGAKFVLVSGKDELKLDEKGQDLAKDYLKNEDAKTKVTLTCEKDGDMLKVTKIEEAKEE